MNRNQWVVAAALSLATQGCTKHFYSLHTSFSSEASGGATAATVTSSANHRRLAPTIDTVAIRPDRSCRDASHAEREGNAESARVLHIRCGSTMAAFERAFAELGFRVIYWSAIERMVLERSTAMAQQRAERLAARGAEGVGDTVDDTVLALAPIQPEAIAVELGVDALVSINSAEYQTVVFAPDATWQRQYVLADRHGRELAPASAPAALADVFDAYLGANERGIGAQRVPAAGIDLTVQYLQTHETIFFYSHVLVASSREDGSARYFVRCERSRSIFPSRRTYDCRDAVPRPSTDDTRPPRSGSSEHVLGEERVVFEDVRTWTDLLDRVALDAAQRFRAAGSGDARLPGATSAPAVTDSASPSAGAAAPAER